MKHTFKRAFTVKAIWDEEASVFVCDSDIEGLHIEASTIEEFEALMNELAIDLVIANHIPAAAFASKPMNEIVPAILWQRPENSFAVA